MSKFRQLGKDVAESANKSLPPALIKRAWRLFREPLTPTDVAEFASGVIGFLSDNAGLNDRWATKKIVGCAQKKVRDGITEYLQGVE